MKSFIDKVSNIAGCVFAGLTTTTPVKVTGGKSNPFLNRVTKRSKQTVLLFGKPDAYARSVNRRMAEEGIPADFTPGPRAFGTRRQNMPVVDHTNKTGERKTYLEYLCFRKPSEVVYFVDGRETPKAEIVGLPDTDAQKAAATQGGQVKKVVYRNVSMTNINELNLNTG